MEKYPYMYTSKIRKIFPSLHHCKMGKISSKKISMKTILKGFFLFFTPRVITTPPPLHILILFVFLRYKTYSIVFLQYRLLKKKKTQSIFIILKKVSFCGIKDPFLTFFSKRVMIFHCLWSI